MNQDIVDNSLQERNDKVMTYEDAIFQSLMVNSPCPTRNTPMNWSFKQQLLQDLRNSLRMEMHLDNPNQKWTEILASFDPHYSLLLERKGLMLRTQAHMTMAYREALLQIQDEESLFLNQVRRRIDCPTTNLPVNIHIELDSEEGQALNTCKDENKNNRGQRDPSHTFPCILHEILSNPEYSECITWLPHGRAWRIIRRAQFERLVIPRHFRHGRYSSFMRQVNGWGFQRITSGPDHNAYHHELFWKDSPQLCCKMSRPTSSHTTRSQIAIYRFHETHRHTGY